MVAIFDLDGTLVDSLLPITQAINDVRNDLYGLKPLGKEKVRQALNLPEKEAGLLLYGTTGFEKEASALFERLYKKRCAQGVPPFEGVEAMLRHLGQTGWRLYVATNAPGPAAETLLEQNGLARYFLDVVGADAVLAPKPDPAMIFHVLAKEPGRRAVMIGDTHKDVKAAERAGIKAVYALWGYGEQSVKGFPKARYPLDVPALL